MTPTPSARQTAARILNEVDVLLDAPQNERLAHIEAALFAAEQRGREALKKYGRHLTGQGNTCDILTKNPETHYRVCTCGLDAALRGEGG